MKKTFPLEKVLAPFFLSEKVTVPFFLPKKLLAPFFLSKKVPAPLSIVPAWLPFLLPILVAPLE